MEFSSVNYREAVAEVRETLKLVDGYDFKNFSRSVRKSEMNFRVGSHLSVEEFDQSGLHTDIVEEINKKLVNSNVIMLIGISKMGTSSIGVEWVSENPDERGFTYLRKGFDMGFDKAQLFIDEAVPFEGAMAIVKDLIGKNKKLILRVHLENVEYFRDGLKSLDRNFEEVNVLPRKISDIGRYLEKTLGLEDGDDCAKVIAGLTGGSPAVANLIAERVVREAQSAGDSLSLSNFKTALVGACDSWDHLLNGWEKKRTEVLPQLGLLIPKTPLLYIKEALD